MARINLTKIQKVQTFLKENKYVIIAPKRTEHLMSFLLADFAIIPHDLKRLQKIASVGVSIDEHNGTSYLAVQIYPDYV